MPNYQDGEGLRAARLLMVLSSISPLFIIWAIRGSGLIPDQYFLILCGIMVFVPYAFLLLRIRTARKLEEKRELVVGTAEDHRDHILVYLFAILLSFYAADLSTWRDLAAALVAIGFIVFLFWHLNLHYMNILLQHEAIESLRSMRRRIRTYSPINPALSSLLSVSQYRLASNWLPID